MNFEARTELGGLAGLSALVVGNVADLTDITKRPVVEHQRTVLRISNLAVAYCLKFDRCSRARH